MTEKLLKKPNSCSFWAILLANLVILTSFEAYSAVSNNIYEINEVNIDVSASSPAGARSAAFTAARRNAFLLLLQRLKISADFSGQVKDDEIADSVRSEQVVDEKILGNQYIAIFNITFAEDFIDSLLEKKGQKVTNKEPERKLSFLVIPVEVLQKKTLVWESGNQFNKYFASALVKQQVDNFKIAEADIDNLTILSEYNIKEVAAEGLEPLFSKYHSDIIYITIFSYNEELRKASVVVRGFEKRRVFQYRLSFVNSGNLSYARLVDKVAQKTVEYLASLKLQDIREQKMASELVSLYIPIKTLDDFLEIKNKIESSGLVGRVNVEAVSRDYAKIFVSYDNPQEIVVAFSRIGLNLTPKAENSYVVLRN